MSPTRNRLYLLFVIACIAGYAWLAWNLKGSATHATDVCIIKSVTSIPCPSCGTTRSVVLLSKGNFSEAFVTNPIGYIVAFIMLALPVWLLTDLLTRRRTLFDIYRRTELFVQRRSSMAIFLLLITANWIWNIAKEL